MRKPETRSLLVAVGVILTACQQAPAPVTPVAKLQGTYTFNERLAGSTLVPGTTIAGEIRFLRDTVLLDTQEGSCRFLRPDYPAGVQTIAFSCPGFWIDVDRRDPLNRSTYRMVTPVVENHTVCTVYGVDAKGNRICIQTGIQSTATSVTRSGYLRLHLKQP